MNWRIIRRAAILVLALLVGVLRFLLLCVNAALHARSVSPLERAQWMHFCGKVVLAAIGIRYRIEGQPPPGPTLIVANHLSYLDIVIFSAALPCSFIAKDDIAAWPAFGRLARLGGTIFLQRESRISAWNVAGTVTARLENGVPVLLFPEGTSTDGLDVLRFHSTLFEPAIEGRVAVTPAAIFYQPQASTSHASAVQEKDVCWFGDDLFLPHLLQVLGLSHFIAIVRFGTPEFYPDRKAAAWRNHDAVSAMRQSRREVSCSQIACAPLGAAVEPLTTRLVETRNSL